jgi:hypothetical protein
LSIVHILAVIVPEGLLIKVTEQVKGFNRNVGAVQAALQKTPEVFQPVGLRRERTLPRWSTTSC